MPKKDNKKDSKKSNNKKNKKEINLIPNVINNPVNIPDISPEKQAQFSDEIVRLHNKISEYLKTYMLVGYNLNGIPVMIVDAKTTQDADSLNQGLQRFLILQSQKSQKTNLNESSESPEPQKPI